MKYTLDVTLIAGAIVTATLNHPAAIVVGIGCAIGAGYRGFQRVQRARRDSIISIERGQLQLASQELSAFWTPEATAAPTHTIDTDTHLQHHLLTTEDALIQVATEAGSLSTLLEDLSHRGHHTRLLALNALMDAAADGDEGQGFGLVAEETLRLAQRGIDLSQCSQPILRRIHGSANTLAGDITYHIRNNDSAPQATDQIASLAQSIASAVTEIEADLRGAMASDERLRGRLMSLNHTLEHAADVAGNLQSLCNQLMGNVQKTA